MNYNIMIIKVIAMTSYNATHTIYRHYKQQNAYMYYIGLIFKISNIKIQL